MPKWVNSFSEVEDLGKGKFGMTIHIGHQVFKDKVDGKWKKNKLTDARPDHVLMQSARCCIKIYPYYAVYYDVNHEEVRVYDSRWAVQVWTGKKWKDLGFWNPTLTIEELPNGVKVVRTGQTTDGILEIEYIQFDAELLKHKITWTNNSQKEKTIRIVMKWSGIVGDKIISGRTTKRLHTAPTIINDGMFVFSDGQHGIGEIVLAQFDEGILAPVAVDLHPNGMKADFEFEEFTVAPNDTVIIDPTTYTNSNPTEDGEIYYVNGYWFRQRTYATVAWGYQRVSTKSGWETRIWRGYVEWDITAIPDSATITLVKFQYQGWANRADDSSIKQMALRPSTSSDEDVFNDAADGTIYLNESSTFPEVGNDKEVGGTLSWDIDPKTDLQGRLTDNWFAFGFVTTEKTSGQLDEFVSEDYSGNPKPTLYVEYTPPPSVGYSYQDGLVCVMVAG